MMYLPFNVYLDSKTVNTLTEAVLPTLPMMYLPFNVYLESKTVNTLTEAVFANITNDVPSLQYWKLVNISLLENY